jgi:hypothetical protein
MERISWKRLIGAVSADDFVHAARTLQAAMEQVFERPMGLELSFYGGMPWPITRIDEFTDYAVAENKAKVFLTLTSLDDPRLPEAWDRAVYVTASIKPLEDRGPTDTTWGHVSAKGRLPKVIAFYVQSPDDNTGCGRIMATVRKERFIGMLTGDGFERHT